MGHDEVIRLCLAAGGVPFKRLVFEVLRARPGPTATTAKARKAEEKAVKLAIRALHKRGGIHIDSPSLELCRLNDWKPMVSAAAAAAVGPTATVATPARVPEPKAAGPFAVKAGERVEVQGYGMGTVRFTGAHHIDGRPR